MALIPFTPEWRTARDRTRRAAACFILAGLQRDAVIADIDVAIRDVHLAARFRIDAIGVGRGHGVDDRQAGDVDEFTEHGIDGPAC